MKSKKKQLGEDLDSKVREKQQTERLRQGNNNKKWNTYMRSTDRLQILTKKLNKSLHTFKSAF